MHFIGTILLLSILSTVLSIPIQGNIIKESSEKWSAKKDDHFDILPVFNTNPPPISNIVLSRDPKTIEKNLEDVPFEKKGLYFSTWTNTERPINNYL